MSGRQANATTGRWRFALTLIVRTCEHCGARFYAMEEARHAPGLCPAPRAEEAR